MFLFFSKLLPPLVFPPGGNIVLLVAAWLLRKRAPRFATALFIVSLAVLYALSTQAGSNALVAPLENRFPDVEVAHAPEAQAIVVLGGGVRASAGRHAEPELERDRLPMGMELYRAGKAPLIVYSGGNIDFLGARAESEAAGAERIMKSLGIPAAAIVEEGASRNTRENAVFTWSILSARGVRRILLVTSALHMPRSAALFRHVGFEVIPAPCDHITGWGKPAFPFFFLPEPDKLSETKDALREYAGLLVYRMRGWL